MGVTCLQQSKYTAAAACFFESLKAGEAIKNNNLIALAYDNISTVYAAEKKFIKALEYSFKALKIRQQENNTEGMVAVLSSIGSKYVETGDSANAGNYFKKALSLYEKTENKPGIATVYSNISMLYKKDYKLKIMYELKSQAIWDEIGPLNLLSIINTVNIGVTYLDIARNGTGEITPGENIPAGKTNQLNKAIAYFEKAMALSKETNDINNEAFFTGNLAEAQELAGDYKNAYINFRCYQRVQDSVYS